MRLLPEIPTFDELGIPGIGVSWMAVMAPKGRLPEPVSGLNRELTRVLALPDLIQAWSALGRQVAGGARKCWRLAFRRNCRAGATPSRAPAFVPNRLQEMP
jgi:hypothetical protein